MALVSKIIDDARAVLSAADIPSEVGEYTRQNDGLYAVLMPYYNYIGEADDDAVTDCQTCSVYLYKVGNVLDTADTLIAAFRAAGFYITDRSFGGRDTRTGLSCFIIEISQLSDAP